MGNFNWVDLLSIILLIRIGYIGFKSGLYIETFKLLAILFSVVIGLHFLEGLESFLKTHLFFSEWLAKELTIISILIVFFLIFFALRILLSKIMSTKFIPQVDKTGAIILGIVRGILTTSLVLVMLNFLPSIYLQKSIWNRSLSGPLLIKIAPGTYKYFIKFVPHTKTNEVLT